MIGYNHMDAANEVNLQLIEEARKRIQKLVPPTPMKESKFLESVTGIRTFLKLENLNISGSFKIRGAANALLQLPNERLKLGVVCASAGNHAQGVAHTCRQLGVKASIFMPERTPLVKVEATRNLGGEVYLVGETYDDAFQEAVRFQAKNGGEFVHPFADAAVINGQGSIGLEILEQVSDLGVVIVPVGGGGMIGGIATAIKEKRPDIRVIGVETVRYPSMKESLAKGEIVATVARPSIADGISVKQVAPLTFAIAQKYVDEVVLVEEEEIASSIMMLMERDHILAEGGGAVSAAALVSLRDRWKRLLDGKSAVCVISGGNIDVNLLTKINFRGLVHSGRLMRLRVRIKDRPGSMANLLNVTGLTGANLMEVHHNRLFGETQFDDVEVELDLETSNHAHQERVKAALQSNQFAVEVINAERESGLR